jgi:hypothetical protein
MIMRIQLTPGTSLTTIEGKSVLFSVKTGESYGLNETAGEMLRLSLERGMDEVAEQLAKDYGTTVDEMRSDLNELVQNLVEIKLAQMMPDQGS